MNPLAKASRALNYCEEWRDTLQFACALMEVPYTPALARAVTLQLVPLLRVDEQTLEVSVTVEAAESAPTVVAEYAAEYPPEPVEPQSTELAELRQAITDLQTQIAQLLPGGTNADQQ